MQETKAYAAQSATDTLKQFIIRRREPGPKDVQIEILYCGVCHSDIHQVRNEWNNTKYPIVPGHEIIGRVVRVGKDVKKFKEGDMAGVGCLVDSCRTCTNCRDGLEQFCDNGSTATYNSFEKDGATVTYGGYSDKIVVTEDFALKIPASLPADASAPLLCAGITTYSPLRYWKIGKGHKLGVVGLGGLGHMAVKFGVSFGAEVTMISTSPEKEKDAHHLGAHHFLFSRDASQITEKKNHFDFILNTVSAPHDYNMYLSMLNTNGVMICVGAPPEQAHVIPFSLIGRRRSLAGSLIGGLPETQEMLDYCGKNNITCDIELINMNEINEAFERMINGDVKYRFVIDMKTI